jgi:hypothetical protein
MQNYTLSAIVLALVVYKWFPISENNLLILLDSKTDNPNKLLEIRGLIAAFKIETNLQTYWREGHAENEMKVIITSLS